MGAPPVAIRMYLAVTFSPVASRSVCGVLEHRAGLDARVRRTFRHWRCRPPSSRAISLSLLAIRVGQSKVACGMVQPKPAASSISWRMCEAIDQQLFRHAAADHAGAAHAVFFGDHHLRAVAGGDAGGAHPARTSSDHEQVDVELSHGQLLLRGRMANGDQAGSAARLPFATRYSLRSSDFLAALAHLGAEFAVDGFGRILRPVVHIGRC